MLFSEKIQPTVGIKAGLNVVGGIKEKEIVRKMSSHFLVTFSRGTKFKYSDYYFCFLKPSPKYKEMFNLFNEVLMLFSPYSEFDTRTFDFVDKTLYDFNNRVDKICIMIISPDKDVVNKILGLSSENKESKIIVPFSYEEILEHDFNENTLENKFRKYFYTRDLFALESPLKSENYFYGRSHTIQSFFDKYSMGEHAGLFGLRKIGKTSLLFGLQRMINLRNGLSVYIDCQDTAVHKSRWFELLHQILFAIKEEHKLSLVLIDKTEYNEKTASQNFESDIKKIYGIIGNRRILLILDEIEHISFKTSSSEHWRDDLDYIYFWQTLRAIYQRNSDLFSFIVAGVNPLIIEQPVVVKGYDNPIFGLIKPTFLELFNVVNVTEMTENIGKYMGLIFDAEIFSDLTDDYGGHPFLIRHVCSLLNSEFKGDRPLSVSKYSYRSCKDDYDTKIQNYVELIISVLENWYPEEYKLLETLACEGSDAFKNLVINYGNAIEHLIGYGIIKKDNRDYFITINAVATFIKVKSKRLHNSNTKEGRWAEISQRRNSLEYKLRRIIGITLHASMGLSKASEELIKYLEASRKNKIKSIDANGILQELYLKDLKQIILNNWVTFEKIFTDKRKFEMYMDLVNQNRIDAHGKEISDDDLDMLRIALVSIEKIIEPLIA